MGSLLVQRTVLPTFTVTLAGVNVKFWMVTSVTAPLDPPPPVGVWTTGPIVLLLLHEARKPSNKTFPSMPRALIRTLPWSRGEVGNTQHAVMRMAMGPIPL